MSLVAGCDLSTKRVDLAAITYDDPATIWTAWRLIAPCHGRKDRAAMRTRCAGDALHDCIVDIHRQSSLDITSLAVEFPIGKYATPLLPVYGAMCATVPARITLTGMAASEWRHTLGAKNTKVKGHEAVYAGLEKAWGYHPNIEFRSYDEHELDAIGIALAYRAMQWDAA